MVRLTLMAAALQGILANPDILTHSAVRKADDGWVDSLVDFAEKVAIRAESRLKQSILPLYKPIRRFRKSPTKGV